MQELWESLISQLTEMLTLYQGLLTISQRKKNVLVSGKTEELDAITKQEQLVLVELGRLEKVRKDILEKIMVGHNLQTDQVTLLQVKKLANQDSANRLGKLGDSLKAIGIEITAINDINTQLIKQALKLVNYNINILARNVADPNYAPQGQSGNATQARVFVDQKV